MNYFMKYSKTFLKTVFEEGEYTIFVYKVDNGTFGYSIDDDVSS